MARARARAPGAAGQSPQRGPRTEPLVGGSVGLSLWRIVARAFQFAIRIDSIRYANRFESIRLVKKIGLSIH